MFLYLTYPASNKFDANGDSDLQGTRITLIGRINLLSWMMAKPEVSQKALPVGKSRVEGGRV